KVKYYIAVASGKGGVGKSTVAVNLAVAIAKKRKNVGLMDADIWGPSLPIMLGVTDRPHATDENKIIPLEKHGLKLMSIGFLISDDETVIWRGPMVHGAIKQFIEDVEWGDTEYLVVDLPPGTGDAQLSIVQTAPLSGGLIVTTPQDVALVDVKRGVNMFRKLNVPIVGVVENMSYLDVPGAEPMDIFGRGGGRRMAEKFEVPFLGEIPLDPRIRKGGDSGVPIVESDPDTAAGKAFDALADIVLEAVENPGK
ncbi:MAG: Mrp/NBP35 family ATP-binding protein, partial [Candidatus Dadabacteria bacterium]|nr:Mrp/NBP35 family ATP-binding protein [Candidatus Dadabacteria bacterium]